MDLTVYLFDAAKQIKPGGVITSGIVQLIHKERARTLSAEIPVKYAAKPGEYLGFRCVDGRFRLFAIEYADDDDNTATTIINATDAAKDELTGTVLMVTEQEGAKVGTAARELIQAAGWTVGLGQVGDKVTNIEGGLKSAWMALEALEADGNLFIDPYYEFDGHAVTGRVVDLCAKDPVKCGRLVQRGTDAENIVITHKGRPRPMIFPVGEDNLTIADVVWDTKKGDPVDKPAGQLWIGVTEAVAAYPGQGQVLTVTTDDPAELMAKGWEKAQQATAPGMTATAMISDMEMVKSQTWKSIRLFYLVRVRPRFGQDAEAQVIEIARNYVRNDQTKITLGEEPDSSAKAIRGLVKKTEANTRELGKYKAEWKDMLVTVKELDEYTRTTITQAWIDLKAGTESSFAQIGSRLDNTDAQNEKQFRTLSESVLTLQNDLDSATAQLTARLTQAEGETQRMNEALLLLDANLNDATAALSARVDDNEAAIVAKASELGTRIDLKADVTYVQTLVAEKIEAAKSEIGYAISENILTNYLIAYNNIQSHGWMEAPTIRATSGFEFRGNSVSKTTLSVVTGISGASRTVDLMTTDVGDSTELSFWQRGDMVDIGLYKEGKEMAVAGEIYEGVLYQASGFQHVVGDPVTLTRVQLRGTPYLGKLYDADGDPIPDTLYLGDGNYVSRVPSGVTEVYKPGKYVRTVLDTDMWFGGGTFCYRGESVRVQGDEFTDAVFYSGGKVTINMQEVTALTA